MKEIVYTITDEMGIHARPAGQLVKLAGKYSSDVKISLGDKTADGKRIFGIMGLVAKQGNEIKIAITGEDEEIAYNEILDFLKGNL